MKMRLGLTVFVLVLLAVSVAGCNEEEPTPTTAIEVAATATATELPVTNTPMPTPAPTETAQPTPVPTPTATFLPTATPIPLVEVLVIDTIGQPVAGAIVRLVQDELGYEATYTTLIDGRAVFAGLQPSAVPYRVEVAGTGYRPATAEVIVGEGGSEVSLTLEKGVVAVITPILANLRRQPNFGADIVAEVSQGTVLPVIDVSDDGEWLQVVTEDGLQGWLFAELAVVEGDLNLLAAATPTPAPAVPAAEGTATTPVATTVPGGAAAPPQGPNLVLNPGFEEGNANWLLAAEGSVQVVSAADYSMFVYAGQQAASAEETTVIHQTVFNVIPGTTYRFTAWGRIWSSDGQDRAVSQNPGDLIISVCINTNGDDNPSLPASICSGSGRPLDTWQNFAVDAVATTDRLSVLLVSSFQSGPANNLTLWDATALGISPVALEATPVPTVAAGGTPTRPDPVPFEPLAFRENIDSLRVTFEQMGGLLDRMLNGEGGICDEYSVLYRQVVEIPTYSGIPAEWQPIYDLYIQAADNVLFTSETIVAACATGGQISLFSLQVARSTIIDSIDTVYTAATAADVLLNQQS